MYFLYSNLKARLTARKNELEERFAFHSIHCQANRETVLQKQFTRPTKNHRNGESLHLHFSLSFFCQRLSLLCFGLVRIALSSDTPSLPRDPLWTFKLRTMAKLAPLDCPLRANVGPSRDSTGKAYPETFLGEADARRNSAESG